MRLLGAAPLRPPPLRARGGAAITACPPGVIAGIPKWGGACGAPVQSALSTFRCCPSSPFMLFDVLLAAAVPAFPAGPNLSSRFLTPQADSLLPPRLLSSVVCRGQRDYHMGQKGNGWLNK